MLALGYYTSRTAVHVFVLAAVSLIIPEAGASSQETVYFAGVQVAMGHSPLGRHTCHVYQYDSSLSELQKVWSLPDTKLVSDIRVYPDYRALVVAVGKGVGLPEELYVVPQDSVQSAYSIDLKGAGQIVDYRFLTNRSIPGLIELKSLNSADRTLETVYVRGDRKSTVSGAALAGVSLEPDLAGSRSAYYGGQSDIVSVRLNHDGTLVPMGGEFTINASPVPDSVVTKKTSNGWVLIANRAGFRALMSVPDQAGQVDKEILLQDRHSGRWSSVLIPGAETSLRLTGDWFAGVIMVENPDNDWERRLFFESVRTDQAVLLDPLTGRSFVVSLGDQCEILWIENDDVYYRVGDELYQARIEGDDFIDRKLLVKDRIVRGIHWAFSGRE